MKLAKNPPSQESLVIQTVLNNQAIAANLERKRRLGQYAVFWENDKVVYGDDAPQPTQKHD